MGTARAPVEIEDPSDARRARLADVALVAIIGPWASSCCLERPRRPSTATRRRGGPSHPRFGGDHLVVALSAPRSPCGGLVVTTSTPRRATPSVPSSIRRGSRCTRCSPAAVVPTACGLSALIVTVTGYAIADRGPLELSGLIGIAVAFLVAVLLGDVTRSRRELAASQRAAMDLHDREQHVAMERLVLQERARLARELHDSLGHAINVMVMQAGVGRHVFDERPQFACARHSSTSRASVGSPWGSSTPCSRCSGPPTARPSPSRCHRRWPGWSRCATGSGPRGGRSSCSSTTWISRRAPSGRRIASSRKP